MDWSINIEHAEIDVTSHDSSGTREIISGIDQWSGTAEMLHVMTSGGPGSANAIFDVMVGKTLVDFEFYPTGSSQDGWYEGSGFFTGFELNAPIEGALATNLSIVGSGQLTRQST
jgi:predicted secreted protein